MLHLLTPELSHDHSTRLSEIHEAAHDDTRSIRLTHDSSLEASSTHGVLSSLSSPAAPILRSKVVSAPTAQHSHAYIRLSPAHEPQSAACEPERAADQQNQEQLWRPAREPSVLRGQQTFVGAATEAAEYAAALSDILDSFGGPVSIDGWARLASRCPDDSTSGTLQAVHSASTPFLLTTAQDLQWKKQQSQHAQAASAGHSDVHWLSRMALPVSCDDRQQQALLDTEALCAMPVFNQQPSQRLPSALPIWSLDIPTYTEQHHVANWQNPLLPCQAQATHVPTLHSSHQHLHEQEVPRQLPVMPHVSAEGAKLALTPLAIASAATTPAALADVTVTEDMREESKPRKKKGTDRFPLGWLACPEFVTSGAGTKELLQAELLF